MKKILAVAVALAVVALAGTAMAAGSANLTVQATVSPGCGINSTSAVTFLIDPGSAVNATASGSVNAWCTTGVSGTVAITGFGLNGGAGPNMYMLSGSTGYLLRYTLNIPNTTVPGAGSAAPVDVTINGTVAQADFVAAPPAVDYTDTVLVTITP